jgi:hypothetical protein
MEDREREGCSRSATLAAKAAGIFIVVSAVHLAMIHRFGASWDEPLHRVWGQVFVNFLGTWDIRVVENMPGSGVYYGPLFHVANYLLSTAIYETGLLPFVAANHVLTILTFALCCSIVFVTGLKLFDNHAAWLSLLFLALMPQLIAHAQYNPKDVPLMTAAALTLLTSYLALTRRSALSAMIAGICFGVALAVKLSAVLLVPAIGACYLATLWSARQFDARADVKLAGVAGISALVTTYLLWPSLWIDPNIVFRGFSFFGTPFWRHNVLYFGVEYPSADLPWHYVPFHLVAGLPLPTLGFFIVGIVVGLLGIVRGTHISQYTLLFSWIVFPLLVSLKPGLVRYDGYRQFFFTLPAVAIVSAVGLTAVAAGISQKLSLNRTAAVFILATTSFAWILRDTAQVFPYTGSYFNAIALSVAGQNLEGQLELEVWGVSYKEGVDWLNREAEAGSRICVPIAGSLVGWYPIREDLKFGCETSANYIMYFLRTAYLGSRPLPTVTPIFEVRRYGARLMVIQPLK